MIKIVIRENTSIRLTEIVVGRSSAFECVIVGVSPTHENVQISFGQSNGSQAACACSRQLGGEWKCYAGAGYFGAAMTGAYHVTARTHKGDSVHLGTGSLKVVDSVMNVASASVPVLPDDCYVRGQDGLYYKVTAALDEDGVPYMIVDRNGVAK